jgi:hypothetical protein
MEGKSEHPGILTFARPDRRRSLGIRRLKFHRDDQGGIRSQSERGEVFPVEMQADRLAQVGGDRVQCFPLRDHGDLDTLGDVA